MSGPSPIAAAPRGHHFTDDEGNVYLVRCYDCGKENWAMAVASGQCNWCGSMSCSQLELTNEQEGGIVEV